MNIIMLLFVFIALLHATQGFNLQSQCAIKTKELTINGHLKCANLYAYQVNQENEITIAQNQILSDETSVDHLFVGDITVLEEEDSLDQILVFQAQVILQTGIIRASMLTSSSFKELLQVQWQLVHHDDFESDQSLVGWNVPYKSYCNLRNIRTSQDKHSNPEADHFLTTHCSPHLTNLTKVFNIDQPHKHVKITAEIHVFGDWTGESIALLVDGKIGWTKTFQGIKGGVSHYECPNLQALSIPVEAIVDTTEREVKVEVISTQKRHPCDGSFAIDDLIVYLK